jgi:DNA-binding NarL/FixJ family response regulator
VTSVVAIIRVLVVDDHPILRDGIAALLEPEPGIAVVGEAQDGAEGVEAYRRLLPDVVLMDLQLPGLDGVQATQAIRAEHSNARIVILTTYNGDAQATRALKAGAAGYLLKSGLRRELVEAIRTVHAGRRYIPAAVAGELALYTGGETLSDREIQVLRQVTEGRSNKEIAVRLRLSEETVKAHLKSIFSKLDVADRTHAVVVAGRRGFLTL